MPSEPEAFSDVSARPTADAIPPVPIGSQREIVAPTLDVFTPCVAQLLARQTHSSAKVLTHFIFEFLDSFWRWLQCPGLGGLKTKELSLPWSSVAALLAIDRNLKMLLNPYRDRFEYPLPCELSNGAALFQLVELS